MKVINAEFVTSAAAGGRADGIPHDGLAQIAMAGRSNVGKSTLINALVRTKIARTSAAPGKTRLANVYRITVDGGPGGPGRWSVYFVDLPGYGYARGGADAAQELALVAQGYYASRSSLLAPRSSPKADEERTAESEQRRTANGTFLLVDSRHPGLMSDVQAHRWLSTAGPPPLVLATKVDKLTRADRVRNLRELERVFGTSALPVSATGGEGLDDLWKVIANLARPSGRRETAAR